MTGSCSLPPKLKTSLRYKNLVIFSNTSPSSVTTLLPTLPVEPEHFCTKFVVLLRLFRIPEHFLCYQQLHLMHRMELLPTPLLQIEHGNRLSNQSNKKRELEDQGCVTLNDLNF